MEVDHVVIQELHAGAEITRRSAPVPQVVWVMLDWEDHVHPAPDHPPQDHCVILTLVARVQSAM